jgi:ABC-type transporter Mla maintaining outer membrane lipid asymmetry ATPase subunit MlaF
VAAAVVFKQVEKSYGGLRPLRVRDLEIPSGRITMLIGFDQPAAEVFVNLMTGASLPDVGEVVCFGQPTRDIATSDQWLSFVERFGVVSPRIVLLEAMTVAQNLAISYDLKLDPVPAAVLARVSRLAGEVGINPAALASQMAEAGPLLRARVYLARALALDPSVLVLEHPSAQLSTDDAGEYAGVIRLTSETRGLTTVGLLMDEKFARATGGRLLTWQPASGGFTKRFPIGFIFRR